MTTRDDDPNRRSWHTDAQWRALSDRIAVAESRRRRWRGAGAVMAAAASMLLIARVSGWSVGGEAAASWHTEFTRLAERREVVLADGTRIALAPATTLRYLLSDTARTIELTGMAQFTVTHNAQRPFRVHAGQATAEDIGTVFTVRAYADDPSVRVAVREGEVALAGATRDRVTTARPLALRAGRAGSVSVDGTITADTTVSAMRIEDWTSGTLSFRDASLNEVARELHRWFGVEVEVGALPSSTVRISASYPAPELAAVLDAITTATKVRALRTERGIRFVAP